MFGGGLAAADLSRMRAEKKQKGKEAKEKKDIEGHGDSLETDACDVGDHNHIANLVFGLVKQNIEDVVLVSYSSFNVDWIHLPPK
ncbi:hypothetical protein F2Q69_00046278 [Brassica cretica]|uniref:Uncharacterized protein n=1 Tax=Brassica cretica TaxID=69181 RepID=A0A8S9Q0Q6_BRACR|nr:hypothetical protein F2Q69_00046278 [Brassica cretica]